VENDPFAKADHEFSNNMLAVMNAEEEIKNAKANSKI
jgi:hypothetical protein